MLATNIGVFVPDFSQYYSQQNSQYESDVPVPTFLKLTSTAWGRMLALLFPWLNNGLMWNNALNVVLPGVYNNKSQALSYNMSHFLNNAALPPLDSSVNKTGSQFMLSWKSNSNCIDMYILSLFSIMLCLVLAWYLNQVLVTSEGFSRVFYFPFQQSFWFSSKPVIPTESFGDPVIQEQIDSYKASSMRVYKITKIFKNQTAVKEFSIQMEKGNCYSLLGQNGCGKTSTINCLTGVSSPTYGEAFIFGLNVKTNIDSIRNIIGVCSQQDMLYPALTGAQHIAFYARFRNVKIPPGRSFKAYIQEKLEMVQLRESANLAVRGYSGGMKRRLSVALSTIGDDIKIIFLDEPTTGLDPLSKRKVWKIVESLKKDKIVLLTTHSMNEADNLSDFIYIMHGGKLKAAGNPSFLKNRYGNGYQLSLLNKNASNYNHDPQAAALAQSLLDCWTSQVLPFGKIVSSSAGSITVGVKKECVAPLVEFLRVLQTDDSFVWSIGNSSLDEVFFKLCSENDGVNERQDNGGNFCRLCNINKAETVTLYTPLQVKVVVSDVICSQCCNGESPGNGTAINSKGNCVSFSEYLAKAPSNLLLNPEQQTLPLQANLEVKATPRTKSITLSQIKAICMKNMVSDMRLKKTNICTALLILVLNGLFAGLSALLYQGIQQIDDGCKNTFQYQQYFQTVRSCNATKLVETQNCTSDQNKFYFYYYRARCIGVSQNMNGLVRSLDLHHGADSYGFEQLQKRNYYYYNEFASPPLFNASHQRYSEASRPLVWYSGVTTSFENALDPLLLTHKIEIPGMSSYLAVVPDFIKVSNVDSVFEQKQQQLLNSRTQNRCSVDGSLVYVQNNDDEFYAEFYEDFPDIGLSVEKWGNSSYSAKIHLYPLVQVSNSFPKLHHSNDTDLLCYIAGVFVNDYTQFYAIPYYYDQNIVIVINSLSNALLRQHLGSTPVPMPNLNPYFSDTTNFTFEFGNFTNEFRNGSISGIPITGQKYSFSSSSWAYTPPPLLTGGQISVNYIPVPEIQTGGTPKSIGGSVVLILVVMLATGLVFPRLVSYWINEKILNLAEMMRVQGLKAQVYWISNYLYGMAFVSIFNIFTMIIGFALLIPFKASSNQGGIVLMFILWSHTQVCIAIFLSSIFRKPITAALMTYFGYLVGILIVVFLILNADQKTYELELNYAAYIFMPLAFGQGLNLCLMSEKTSSFGPIAGILFASSTAIGLFGLYIHLIRPGILGVSAMDPFFGLFKRRKASLPKSTEISPSEIESGSLDEDVLKEADLVKASLQKPDSNCAVKLVNICKNFGNKQAVGGISLRIPFGESFGLLGPNG